MFSAASVCLFVCLFVCVYLFVCRHDNFRTSKLKHKMMKLGGRWIVQKKSRLSSNFWLIAPLGAHPLKCGVGLRRWENQRRLPSFNVIIYFISIVRCGMGPKFDISSGSLNY